MIAMLSFPSFCFPKTSSKTFFEKGAIVCFVGNSITQAGGFHHNALLYHITRFPDKPLAFYNCGIGGSVTGSVLERMEDDILVHNPTHAVIMLGMNDINRSLYGSGSTTNSDTIRYREDAISNYKVNLERIVNIFLTKNIKVILQQPSIYDQTAVLPIANNYGANDALKRCADFIGELGKKYQLPVVDYWTVMSQINHELQNKDQSATIVGPDRVHPGTEGHLIMAYQFLKSENAPKYISKIIVDNKTKKGSTKSVNCEFRSVSKRSNGLVFTVCENALPFPMIKSQQKGFELIPFMKELNVELLQVLELKQGLYQLSIDGKIIGVFSDKQLIEGINLAEYKDTPQYQQAIKVQDMLDELIQKEGALRGIKYIEYNSYFKTCPDKKNLTVVKTYLDSLFRIKYNNPYLMTQLKNYPENKPLQKELEEVSDNLRKEVYRIAQPTEHQFTIVGVGSSKNY